MLIRLTVDRIEGNKVVMLTEDKVTLFWPKEKMPLDIHEGSVIFFDIKTAIEIENDKRQQAKDILNEILKAD